MHSFPIIVGLHHLVVRISNKWFNFHPQVMLVVLIWGTINTIHTMYPLHSYGQRRTRYDNDSEYRLYPDSYLTNNRKYFIHVILLWYNQHCKFGKLGNEKKSIMVTDIGMFVSIIFVTFTCLSMARYWKHFSLLLLTYTAYL